VYSLGCYTLYLASTKHFFTTTIYKHTLSGQNTLYVDSIGIHARTSNIFIQFTNISLGRGGQTKYTLLIGKVQLMCRVVSLSCYYVPSTRSFFLVIKMAYINTRTSLCLPQLNSPRPRRLVPRHPTIVTLRVRKPMSSM